jgi:hypothetical protein
MTSTSVKPARLALPARVGVLRFPQGFPALLPPPGRKKNMNLAFMPAAARAPSPVIPPKVNPKIPPPSSFWYLFSFLLLSLLRYKIYVTNTALSRVAPYHRFGNFANFGCLSGTER